ncbi:MAG: cation diffusion facilitator family transporter [Candidatus Lokiarchaeota archaeon]|nr:cation diffusion facilitator family transporter [Candidatus Lokiarchaeota archaeon]
MSDSDLGLQRGERIAKASSATVAFLGLAKGATGLLTGSISLLAQAVDSFTDLFASMTVYIGVKFARRKPTDRFPYGYYRAETFATLIVAAITLLSGVGIAWEAIMQLLLPSPSTSPFVAMFVAAVSIPFLYVLARYNKRVGDEANSQAIAGQGRNFRIDMYSSAFVFIGVLFSYLGAPWVEGSIALAISALILKTGVELGKGSILALMDATLNAGQIAGLKAEAESVPGVIGVHGVRVRRSGPMCFGEMHIEVNEGVTVDKAHAITEEIERRLKATCKQLEAMTIHVEPRRKEKVRVAVLTNDDEGLDSTTTPHFGSASHVVIVETDKGEIKGWAVKANPGKDLTKKRGITTADFLKSEGVDVILAGGIGEGPFHVLRDGLVEVYDLPGDRGVRKALEDYLDGKLEKVLTPKET